MAEFLTARGPTAKIEDIINNEDSTPEAKKLAKEKLENLPEMEKEYSEISRK